MRILVAEDDEALRSVLGRAFEEAGYVVDAVSDGEAASFYLRTYEYEVAVIDWRMPRRSGLEVVEDLRQRGGRAPVVMLTARDTTTDRVQGLNSGADDYLVKPFDFAELLARVQALQRRPPLAFAPVLRCGDLALDPAARRVTVGDELVSLTATELGLLEVLLRRAPSVVSRQTMAVHVWNDESDAVGSNTIEVHVGRLRTKLGGSCARIETVRGTGYRVLAA